MEVDVDDAVIVRAKGVVETFPQNLMSIRFFFLTVIRVLHILPPSSVLGEGPRLSQQLS